MPINGNMNAVANIFLNKKIDNCIAKKKLVRKAKTKRKVKLIG